MYPGADNTLRESPGNLNCPRFPPFFFDYPRPAGGESNPFLVILNAEIKFRRYFRQVQPPPLQLPTNVMNLVHLTTQLVKLVYWVPVTRPNTKAEEFLFNTEVHRLTSRSLDAEMGRIDEEDQEETLTIRTRRGGGMRRPAASTTLEERMEYGQFCSQVVVSLWSSDYTENRGFPPLPHSASLPCEPL